MTVSRADRRISLFPALLFAGLICVSPSPAAAQDVQTAPLDPPAAAAPQPQPAQSAAPIRLGPRRLIQSPAQKEAEKSGQTGPGGVEIETLESVDADSVGTLGDLEGGLGAAMWGGSDRALVVRLLTLLPRTMPSPAQRDLTRRLLLTRAEAPPRTAPGPAMLPLRVNALYAMGDYDSAMTLMGAAPPGNPDEQLLRIRAEILFHRHDVKGACALVQGDAQDFKDAYWQQAQAYCLAVNGKAAQAVLLSDILAERAQSVDPAFFVGMDALSGAQPEALEGFKFFNALLASLLRTGKVPLSENPPPQPAAGDLAALALSPNAPVSLRMASGEIAALNGALKPSGLADIYRVEKFEAAALSEAVSGSDMEWGARARAMLIQAAMAQSVPAARAEALQRAIELARIQGDLALTAQAVSYPLRGIRPAPELAWFAPSAARGLAASGAFAPANDWIRLNQRQTQTGETESLWHLAVLSGVLPQEAVTEEALRKWQEARQAANPDGFAVQARVFYALLHALGIPVPGALWSDVVDADRTAAGLLPPGAIRALLSDATAAGRVGETVALSLIMLGEEGASRVNFAAAEQVIAALSGIGQKDAARQIALEAAVAAGL